jgi:hypothetical protein
MGDHVQDEGAAVIVERLIPNIEHGRQEFLIGRGCKTSPSWTKIASHAGGVHQLSRLLATLDKPMPRMLKLHEFSVRTRLAPRGGSAIRQTLRSR